MKKRVPAHSLGVAVLSLVSSSAFAQSVHQVGPTGHAQISDAVAVAAPGDLIVVAPGTYLPFAVPIGVRIVAPDGATVTTPPGGYGIPWVHDVNPPTGQKVTIVGLEFRTNSAYPPAEPPVALNVTGNVVFADCIFHNWPDYPSAAVTCNGDVQFDRCEWSSVHDAMVVQGGRVEVNDCVFQTAWVMWAAGTTRCIVTSGGEIRLNTCNLQASSSGSGAWLGSPAIQLDGSARLSLADCEVRGGDSPGWASTGVVNNTSNAVEHARSHVIGGHGMLSWFQTGMGPGFAGPHQEVLLAGGVGTPAGPGVGASYGVEVIGPFGGITGLVLSFERSTAFITPFTVQPIHFDPATATALAIGLTSGFSAWPGYGTYMWLAPQLTPAMFGAEFWIHPIVFDGTLFQVGPTFGRLVR